MKYVLLVSLLTLISCGYTYQVQTYSYNRCDDGKCYTANTYLCKEVKPIFLTDGIPYRGLDLNEANKVCLDLFNKHNNK